MKRVLQVLGSLQRGGAESLVMNIYRNIDRNEIQFDFIVREYIEEGYEKEVKQLGGRIFVIPSPQRIGLLRCIKEHIKIIKNNGPYIAVHSHMNAMSFISMYSAKKCGIRNRISHSHSTSFPGKLKSKIGGFLTKLFSNKLLACSEDAGKKLFQNNKFDVITNGIDINKFILANKNEQLKYKEKLNMNDDKLYICHIGRFVEPKNHEFIIEIAEKLKVKNINFEITLLGNGPKFSKIKKLVDDRNLKEYVKLLGSIPNIDDYLKAVDLLILPSLYEGFPVTLVESQASGLPALVSTNITKKVDFGLNLISFVPLNIEEWVNAIINDKKNRLFNKNDIYDKITQNKYNIEYTTNEMLKIYSKKG